MSIFQGLLTAIEQRLLLSGSISQSWKSLVRIYSVTLFFWISLKSHAFNVASEDYSDPCTLITLSFKLYAIATKSSLAILWFCCSVASLVNGNGVCLDFFIKKSILSFAVYLQSLPLQWSQSRLHSSFKLLLAYIKTSNCCFFFPSYYYYLRWALTLFFFNLFFGWCWDDLQTKHGESSIHMLLQWTMLLLLKSW